MIEVKDIQKFRKVIDKVYQSDKYQKLRKDMDRYLKYFQGEFWKVGEKGHKETDSEIFCNYIFSTIMTIAPLITDNRPIWYLRPRQFFLQKLFNIYAEVLEYAWDKLDCEMKLFKTIVISMIMKVGIWKIFFDPDGDDARIDIVDPRSFVIAPGFDDPWEAPWCGTKTRRSLAWVLDRYPDSKNDLKREDADGNLQEQEIDWDKYDDAEGSNEFLTVYEMFIRDKTAEMIVDETAEEGKKKKKKSKYPNGRFTIFTKSATLEDKPSIYRHGRAPFVPFYDYLNPFEFFGMGEPDQIETLNLEFNFALKKMSNYVRRWCGLDVALDAGSGLDPDTFKQEAPGGENAWSIATGSEPPTPIIWPTINRTILDFMSAIPRLIQEVSGVQDVAKGMVTKKERQSASEIATLIESSYTRTRQRVRNVEWSIKRSLWLVTDIMQQFYTEPRSYNRNVDGTIEHGMIGNSTAYVGQLLKPKEYSPAEKAGMEPPEEQEIQTQEQDYKKFLEVFGAVDEVYADFDLEVQTNSTLPMDRQSLANLMLRLFELKGVDAEALLEILRIPKGKEIVQRMTQQQQAEQTPPQPPQMPIGGQ